jgi:hypothetical protein
MLTQLPDKVCTQGGTTNEFFTDPLALYRAGPGDSGGTSAANPPGAPEQEKRF